MNNTDAPQFDAWQNKTSTKLLICRVVASAWVPQTDPKAIFVDHLDENRANNHPSNLEWVTHEENHRRVQALHPDKMFKAQKASASARPKQRSARARAAWVTRRANNLRKAA